MLTKKRSFGGVALHGVPMRIFISVLIALSTATLGEAQAQVTPYNNLASFQAASNTTIQATFDSLPPATGIPSPLIEGSVILSVLPGARPFQVEPPGDDLVSLAPHTSNVLVQNGNEDFDIAFSGPPPTAVGFDTYTNAFGPPIVTVFDTNNILIGTFALAQPPQTLGFFGVTSSVPIGRMHWLADRGGLLDTGIDNVRVGSTLTLACPLTILPGVSVSNIDAFGATVNWTTNVPADSIVEYGITPAYGNFTLGPVDVTNHSVSLIGLTPRTPYHFSVISTTPMCSNVASSPDETFVTNWGIPKLVITEVSASRLQNQYVIIVTISNQGTGRAAAYDVTVTTALIGNKNPDFPPLPDRLGGIVANASARDSLNFPLSLGSPNSVVEGIVAGTYRDAQIGGRLFYFGRHFRVRLVVLP